MTQEPLHERTTAPSARAAAACVGVVVAGAPLILDFSGTLFLESWSMLIVADLHLEKGSAYARRGMFLPPWDTAATLERLANVVNRWRPKTVVALGDSFHDPLAGDRMALADRDRLRSLQSGRAWIWVAGNHDPAPPAAIEGDRTDEIAIGGLRLRHQPRAGACPGEIAGHLHPAARIIAMGGSVRRKCFVNDGERCVMPAFGAYAGGLNLRDAAFDEIFDRAKTAHVLGREGIYAVHERFCAPE